MINVPRSLDDINKLIDARIQESTYLDYKRSPALGKASKLKRDLAKHVSAFANSGGGVLVYGVVEEDHFPIRVDEGVPVAEITREAIDSVLQDLIHPRVPGLEIIPLPVSMDHFVYVIHIPKSYSGPHQLTEGKVYYRRLNFQAQPMDDYEIEDVRARRAVIAPLVQVRGHFEEAVLAQLVVENTGLVAARHLRLEFEPAFERAKGHGIPRILADGVEVLAAGESVRIHYAEAAHILKPEPDVPVAYTVRATYVHSTTGKALSDEFKVDFRDFEHLAVVNSEASKAATRLEKALRDITVVLKKVDTNLERLAKVTDAHGLSLSNRTIRNLRRVVQGEEGEEPIPARHATTQLIMDEFGLEQSLASRISHRLTHGWNGPIAEMEGVTPLLLAEIRARLDVDEDD